VSVVVEGVPPHVVLVWGAAFSVGLWASRPVPPSRGWPEHGTRASYGALKRDVVDAVVETLRPIQKRYAELAIDPAYVDRVLADGAAWASEQAGAVLRGRRRDRRRLTGTGRQPTTTARRS
jgi:hypothetical protein